MGERLAFTFALSGRRFGFYVTQGVALGLELAGPSAREGRLKNCPPHFASKVSYNASPLTSANVRAAASVKTYHSALTTVPAVLAENSGAYWHWAEAIPHS